MLKPLLIAVDGPAASGKGTLARKIAEILNLEYLETGTLYRAVGYRMLQQGRDIHDQAQATEVAKHLVVHGIARPSLYQQEVAMAASTVATMPGVREALMAYQRQVAKNPRGAVLDGRDIGTVICPEADFKFYITASVEARANRRYKQLQNKENSIIYQDVLEDLKKRDKQDSERSIAPLAQAKDAILMDTTFMDAEEVLERALSVISRGQAR